MHQKLKATPGIYVVGFMGCGKSTVGRLLAERLGWDFKDLDDEIERLAGKPISRIFDEDGEPVFRDLEHEALGEQVRLVRRGEARVVALGGGAFVAQRNRERINGAGLSVWLDTPVETLRERVAAESHRPLARDRAAFFDLHASRRDAYALAGLRIEGVGAPEALIAAILDHGLV